MKLNLLHFFRKALLSNKAVIYEDKNVQIGIMSDFSQPLMARMRLFFACKQQIDPLSNIII